MQPDKLDYSPLAMPVQLKPALRYALSASRYARWLMNPRVGYIAMLVVVVFFLALVNLANTRVVIDAIWQLFVIGVFASFIVYIYYRLGRDAVRLEQFAARNGLLYERDVYNPSLNGLIFSHGNDRVLRYRLSRDGVALSEYEFTTGSGKNRQIHQFSFVSINLTRRLPHIVLDAHSNNILGFSNLPASFNRNQRLQLEGDFDKYFDVYCPVGYERDALYVLTPELMAALVDKGARYDIEIVDDTIYIYASGKMKWTAETIRSLLSPASAIGIEVIDNSKRYADAQVGNRQANLVAPHGQRLKRGVALIEIAIVALGIIVMLWYFAPLFGFFGRTVVNSPAISNNDSSLDEQTLLSLSARNTARNNDVQMVLANTASYAAATNGQLDGLNPAMLMPGLGRYRSVEIVSGAQMPLSVDGLRLVLGAICSSYAATAVSGNRAYAVQYSTENPDGSLTPVCVNG